MALELTRSGHTPAFPTRSGHEKHAGFHRLIMQMSEDVSIHSKGDYNNERTRYGT